MKKLEQKFPATDLEALEELVKRLGAADRGFILQHDYFFPAPNARLKLRVFQDGTGELISYNRPNSPAPRESQYFLCPVTDTKAMNQVLTDSLGPPRELRKRRHLYLFHNTRIHLDQIHLLGDFIGLETVITTQSPDEAAAELNAIVLSLGLNLETPIPTAYIDIIPQK